MRMNGQEPGVDQLGMPQRTMTTNEMQVSRRDNATEG